MKIDSGVIAGSERRASGVVAPAPSAKLPSRGQLPASTPVGPSAGERRPIANRDATPADIQDRARNLSFAGSRPTNTEFERMMGTNDLVDEFYLERALAAAKPVCRLVERSASGREIGYATGFMIGPRVLLTNWHVFRTPADAANAIAEFDYKFDISGNPVTPVRFRIRADRFFHANQQLDYAVVAVEELSDDNTTPVSKYGYHRLIPTTGKILEGEWITIVQHPGGERRQFAIRENKLLAKLDNFIWYMSDTAQGSSGAPAFNDSFQVVALHHSGKAKRDGALYVLRDGRRVPSLEGIDDSDVIWEKNEGVRVSVMCADLDSRLDPANSYAGELLEAINNEEGHVMANTISGRTPLENRTASAPVSAAGSQSIIDERGGLSIPLYLNVSLSYGGATLPVPPPVRETPRTETSLPAEGIERLIPPPVDTDYSNRTGYKQTFLHTRVPLPEVIDIDTVVTLEDGGHVIPYEHFSAVIHKQRRLALFTASNVDGRAAKRKPEPGLYTRKALFGITGRNDRESWLSDPRIPQSRQLPEKFYDRDGKAFDKGHIVRREDVCWGSSREQIVKANADTYHVTNCSPQIKGYNQASEGGLWGQLEDVVLAQAKEGQKLTVIAGPVLSDDDKWFNGHDLLGPVRVQIPRSFWKIVVAEKDSHLQAFAFLLEQDLTTVPLEDEEFRVDEDWTPYLIAIDELEQMLGTVRFSDVLKAADGSGTPAGDEMRRSGMVRSRRAGADALGLNP